MMEIDQRVCRCLCHDDGREDHSACCAHKAQVDRDALADLARRLAEELFGPWQPPRSRYQASRDLAALKAEARKARLLPKEGS